MSQSKTDRLQSIGTVFAIVISVIAMFTSIYEANIMKSQQKAMVWPYINTSQNYNGQGFNISVYNNGTGPAIIKSVEITYKGIPLKDLNSLLDSLKPDRTFGYDVIRSNNINKYVFKSGEEKILFGFEWTDETRQALENAKYLDIKIAYESVLGDYWVYDSKTDSNEQKKFNAKIEYDN
ncbi:hypothetical protein [Winogradskyella flava]|uniref:Uncharacterized protein n=1 Tax=Winogradskyella flava TaxID=1884876 RepID=A0A842ISH8_9FLAO|nr:hypothetical protein [Winogradskyella flava]MBC2845841.1 hypothetical protein [Winogradskyella flava]